MFGTITSNASEPTLMILPRPCPAMKRKASWQAKKLPFRFVSMMYSQSCSLNSSGLRRRFTPAELTRMSKRGSLSVRLLKQPRIAVTSVTSSTAVSTETPVSFTSAAAWRSRSSERAQSTMSAPEWASARAMPSPSPRLPPTITARWPSSRRLGMRNSESAGLRRSAGMVGPRGEEDLQAFPGRDGRECLVPGGNREAGADQCFRVHEPIRQQPQGTRPGGRNGRVGARHPQLAVAHLVESEFHGPAVQSHLAPAAAFCHKIKQRPGGGSGAGAFDDDVSAIRSQHLGGSLAEVRLPAQQESAFHPKAVRGFEPRFIAGRADEQHLRSFGAGQLGGQQADGARPGNRDPVSGPDTCDVAHPVNDAGERFGEGRRFERQAVRNAVEVPGGHGQEARECTVFPGAYRTPHGTQVRAAVPAPAAGAAREEVRFRSDAVTGLPAFDAAPDLGDAAGQLMPERHRRLSRKFVMDDVDVGAADARGRNLDDDLARAGHGFGNFLHADVAGTGRGFPDGQHQPFTAPIVRPLTIQRWMNSVRMMTGRVMSTAAAPRPPKSICP